MHFDSCEKTFLLQPSRNIDARAEGDHCEIKSSVVGVSFKGAVLKICLRNVTLIRARSRFKYRYQAKKKPTQRTLKLILSKYFEYKKTKA